MDSIVLQILQQSQSDCADGSETVHTFPVFCQYRNIGMLLCSMRIRTLYNSCVGIIS